MKRSSEPSRLDKIFNAFKLKKEKKEEPLGVSVDSPLSPKINALIQVAESAKTARLDTYKKILEKTVAEQSTEVETALSDEGILLPEDETIEQKDSSGILAPVNEEKEKTPHSLGETFKNFFRSLARVFGLSEKREELDEAEKLIIKELEKIVRDRKELEIWDSKLKSNEKALALLKDLESGEGYEEKIKEERAFFEEEKKNLEDSIEAKAKKFIDGFETVRLPLLELLADIHFAEEEIKSVEIKLLSDIFTKQNILKHLEDADSDYFLINILYNTIENHQKQIVGLADDRRNLCAVKKMIEFNLQELDNLILSFKTNGYNQKKRETLFAEAKKGLEENKKLIFLSRQKLPDNTDKSLPDFEAGEKAEKSRRQEQGEVENGYGSVAAWAELLLDALGINDPAKREDEKKKNIYNDACLIEGLNYKDKLRNAQNYFVKGEQVHSTFGEWGALSRIKKKLKKTYRMSDSEIKNILKIIKEKSGMKKVKVAQEVKKDAEQIEDLEGENLENGEEKTYTPEQWKQFVLASVKEREGGKMSDAEIVELLTILENNFVQVFKENDINNSKIFDKISDSLEKYFKDKYKDKHVRIVKIGSCIQLIQERIKTDNFKDQSSVSAESAGKETETEEEIANVNKKKLSSLSAWVDEIAGCQLLKNENPEELKRFLKREIAGQFEAVKKSSSQSLILFGQALIKYLKEQKSLDPIPANRAVNLIVEEIKRKLAI